MAQFGKTACNVDGRAKTGLLINLSRHKKKIHSPQDRSAIYRTAEQGRMDASPILAAAVTSTASVTAIAAATASTIATTTATVTVTVTTIPALTSIATTTTTTNAAAATAYNPQL